MPDRMNPALAPDDNPLRSPNGPDVEDVVTLTNDNSAAQSAGAVAAEQAEAGVDARSKAAAKSTKSTAKADNDDLDEYTVEGLHELASEMEIEGRSSMNRGELEKAIRKARK